MSVTSRILLLLCMSWAICLGNMDSLLLGDLVCPDQKRSSNTGNHFFLRPFTKYNMSSCPWLLVEKETESGSGHLLVDCHGSLSRIPADKVPQGRRTLLSGKLQGVAKETIDVLRPSRTPGVVRPDVTIGLLFDSTLSPHPLPLPEVEVMPRHFRPAQSFRACIDSLETFHFHGLVTSQFLPQSKCDFAIDSVKGVRNSRPDEVMDTSSPVRCGEILMAAKPPASNGSRPPWLWGALDCDGIDHWILKFGEREEVIRMDFEYPAEVQSVMATDFGGSIPFALVLETDHHYGDGSYTHLNVVHSAVREPVRAQTIELKGSSGESGGSTVEGVWWLGPGTKKPNRRLLVADARLGNEAGISRGLTIQAYEIGKGDSLAQVQTSAFYAAVFGNPTRRELADAKISDILMHNPQASVAGLMALPWLHEREILWIPAGIAPNEKTARAWTRWKRGSEVRKIPAAQQAAK